MARILLIEPDRILTQAIRLFLFPHHEVQAEASPLGTDIKALKEYNLLIIDGSALRERKQLTPEFARAIQRCETPTLWLKEDESQHPVETGKLLIVKKPIERETFQSALTGLLFPKTAQKGRAGSHGVRGSGGQLPREKERRREVKTQQDNLPFIDLVDVVEEQSLPGHRRKQTRNSR